MIESFSRRAAFDVLRQLRTKPNVAKVEIVERKPWKIIAHIHLTDGKVASYYLPLGRVRGA